MWDQALDSYRYTGAQTVLKHMDPKLHNQWLLKLHDSLTNHVPMSTTLTPKTVIKKKPYYKRGFTPFFVEDVLTPLPVPSLIPNTTTACFTLNTAKYSH